MGNTIGRDTIYREITDKIVRHFENGIVPWVRPWKSGSGLSPLIASSERTHQAQLFRHKYPALVDCS